MTVGKRAGGNPDTTGGLILTTDVLEACRQQAAEKAAAQAAKEEAGEKRKAEAAERDAKRTRLADSVIPALQQCADDVALKAAIAKLTVDQMRAAATLLGGAAATKDSVTKKDLLKAPLREALQKLMQPRLLGDAGGAASPPLAAEEMCAAPPNPTEAD